MDESATPARYRLVTPQELPPADAKVFEEHFALLDERDARVPERPDGSRPTARKPKPITLEEKPPKEGTRA